MGDSSENPEDSQGTKVVLGRTRLRGQSSRPPEKVVTRVRHEADGKPPRRIAKRPWE